MTKPISIVREETITKLAEIINGSGLPPMIIAPILKDMLAETQFAMQKQFEIEKAQYEASIAQKEDIK